MEHDEFIRQVQNRARLDSRGAAEQATRATLETLGERLSGGAAKRYDTDVSADSWRDLFKGGRARKR